MIKKRLFIFLIILILGALFFTLFQQLQKGFADVNTRLANGTMVNLNDKQPGQRIKRLLEKGYYFEDKTDIAFIEKKVTEGARSFPSGIDNIGELNKRRFFTEADSAYLYGGSNFKKRVEDSRSLLGYSGEDAPVFDRERKNPPVLPSSLDFHSGTHSISGKILDQQNKALPGVLVKLQMILPQDSAYANDESAFTEDDKLIKK